MRGVIIQGSSKSNGNTRQIVNLINQSLAFDFVDLNGKNINAFSYENENANDDFIPLLRDITQNYDTFLFATPVYWYAMSAQLKTFFDRLSDCLKFEKELGRLLRGKAMAVISCGYDEETVPGLHEPFEYTAKYLGMRYLGFLHTAIQDDSIISPVVQSKVSKFATHLRIEIEKLHE